MIELALVLSGAAALAWYWWKRRQWLRHERTIVTEQQMAAHIAAHAQAAQYEPDCAFTHQAAHIAALSALSTDDSPTTPVAWGSDPYSGSGFGGAGASDSWDSSSSSSTDSGSSGGSND